MFAGARALMAGKTRLFASFIVVNFRKPEMTIECVRSIRQAMTEASGGEIIIVDNSPDHSNGCLAAAVPDLRIIDNPENEGFAKANNRGIRLARGEVVALVNNDAFINRACVELGISYLSEHPHVGIWAPRLTYADGSYQPSVGLAPTLGGLFGEYVSRRTRPGYPGAAEWSEPRDVETVSGACVFLSRQAIEEAGLLDEDYFFTSEDTDYCARVRERGLGIVYDPRVSIIHLANGSQNWNWLDDPYLHRFRILYFRKRKGIVAAAIAAMFITIGLTRRRVGRLLRGRGNR